MKHDYLYELKSPSEKSINFVRQLAYTLTAMKISGTRQWATC